MADVYSVTGVRKHFFVVTVLKNVRTSAIPDAGLCGAHGSVRPVCDKHSRV